MSQTSTSDSEFVSLYADAIIPLRVCIAGLTWGFHDYFLTLPDEVRIIWRQRPSVAKVAFLWIRYYTLALLIFDVLQTHLWSIQRIHTDEMCIVAYTVTRVAGAVSMWSVGIIMQLRIYALYACSKPIALFNGIFYLGSIGSFIYIMYLNASKDDALTAKSVHLPLPGCPPIHVDTEWILWLPGLAFEAVLCGFALYKTMHRTYNDVLRKKRLSLENILLRDNVLYFIGVALLLTFNILMSKGVTHIPVFGFAPFHAALGIMTTRMLLNVRKATASDYLFGSVATAPKPPLSALRFASTQSGSSTEVNNSTDIEMSAMRSFLGSNNSGGNRVDSSRVTV